MTILLVNSGGACMGVVYLLLFPFSQLWINLSIYGHPAKAGLTSFIHSVCLH